jgi:hypothetical protein
LGERHGGTILVAMGFNPHRVQRRSSWDYVFVGAAILVCAGLLVWAFVG